MLPAVLYAVPTVAPWMGRLKPELLDDEDWPLDVEVDAWVSFDSCVCVDEPEDFDDWDDSSDFEDCDSCGFVDACGVPLDVARPPMPSLRPGWMSDGSEPIASRLSEYSCFQPPSTSCSSAIFAR